MTNPTEGFVGVSVAEFTPIMVDVGPVIPNICAKAGVLNIFLIESRNGSKTLLFFFSAIGICFMERRE
jgi:hypothetical protein